MSVRHALLALLWSEPKYGLQLQEEFEAGTGEVWPLNVGQVYTTLQRLERHGLVEPADSGGSQRMYGLTDSGLEELTRWLQTPPDEASPPRSELVIKILVALRMTDVDVTTLIQVHRRQLVEFMQQYTRLKEEAGDAEFELCLSVDAQIFRLDGLIRWLDTVEARLKRRGEARPGERPTLKSTPERLQRQIGLRR